MMKATLTLHLAIALILGSAVYVDNFVWADGDGKNKQRAPKNFQNIGGQNQAGPMNGGGEQGMRGPMQNGNGFDPPSFSASMIQQFDQDGDGALNQSELTSCLSMLHQQVLQQQQAFAQSAQRQFQQMTSGGGGAGGQGGQGGNCMSDSSTSFSSASASSINGRGQVRIGPSGGGGQAGASFGGGRGGAGGRGGGR